MARHILVVDDDALMRRSLAFNLEQAGFRASPAANAEDALSLARQTPPDLVLLDIGLPGMDGLDAIKRFKEQFHVPVVFVTARRRNLDEVLGLELGADDYITKPFDVDVLIAHIKAVLRRQESASDSVQPAPPLTICDLTLDPSAHTVSLAGKNVELSPKEFNLLHALAIEPNHVRSVDDLLATVWGAEFIGQPQVVYVHIRWLREKLEKDPNHPKRIVTVRGVGYKLVGGE
ncbi:MAG TPA: response regulator transcription factor [Anaerolineales bacterium]|nr:response regulator transcription factor [Anaerolineales bacterium]